MKELSPSIVLSMKCEIVLPFLPDTWNNLKGRSHWPYKRYKDQVGMFMLQHRDLTGTHWHDGVRITFVYGFFSNRRQDIDSLCTKPIIDSMVDVGILPDDSKKILVEVVHRWEFTETKQTKIILEDGLPVPTKTPRK